MFIRCSPSSQALLVTTIVQNTTLSDGPDRLVAWRLFFFKLHFEQPLALPGSWSCQHNRREP